MRNGAFRHRTISGSVRTVLLACYTTHTCVRTWAFRKTPVGRGMEWDQWDDSPVDRRCAPAHCNEVTQQLSSIAAAGRDARRATGGTERR